MSRRIRANETSLICPLLGKRLEIKASFWGLSTSMHFSWEGHVSKNYREKKRVVLCHEAVFLLASLWASVRGIVVSIKNATLGFFGGGWVDWPTVSCVNTAV